MKKWLLSLVLLCSAVQLFARPYHTNQFSQPVRLLYRLEESRRLLASVEQDGEISIKGANFGFQASNAAWMGSERTIYLNCTRQRSTGSLLSSIIFEMHNALSTKQFAYYDYLAQTRQISREQYIEAIERIEYENARSAAYILRRGVQKGVFPPDAGLPVPNNFADHFAVQIDAGHSALIGYIYDDLTRTPNSVAHK